MSLLVDLQNVKKIYHTEHGEYHALKGIDFSLHTGEWLAIVGASGSGKSTLMNVIGFLDQCTTGNYFFSGSDVSHLLDHELADIRNKKIGFVFQSFFLLPRLNVLQNVMLPLFYSNVKQSIAKERAMVILEKVGMQDFYSRKPNQLSGGQQQRVAIARALINDPALILADEPTGALDSKTSEEVMALFSYLHREEKRTIVIVTHDKEISLRCERIVTIKDGLIT